MNSDQVNSLVRSAMKIVGAALIAHGATVAASIVNGGQEVIVYTGRFYGKCLRVVRIEGRTLICYHWLSEKTIAVNVSDAEVCQCN